MIFPRNTGFGGCYLGCGFFWKIQIRISESKNGFCGFFWANPTTDKKSTKSTFRVDSQSKRFFGKGFQKRVFDKRVFPWALPPWAEHLVPRALPPWAEHLVPRALPPWAEHLVPRALPHLPWYLHFFYLPLVLCWVFWIFGPWRSFDYFFCCCNVGIFFLLVYAEKFRSW